MFKTIKTLLAVVCLFTAGAFAQVAIPCSDPGTPHAITGNFSVDLYGPVDTRPGTYGHADYVVWNQPLQNVPVGCRVQILRIDGDFIAWPMGTVAAGGSAGVLVRAYRSTATGSTRAAWAADGYFLYYQHGTNGTPIRIPIHQNITDGYLASDNVVNWKAAEFLNTTGQKIHMEITFSQVVFRYVQ
jgi:hypothetical protein